MSKKKNFVLTSDVIRKAAVPEDSDRVILFDRQVTGFGVIKYKSGRVSFFVDKILNTDKKVRRTIYSASKIWNTEHSVREIRKKAIMISDFVDEVSLASVA